MGGKKQGIFLERPVCQNLPAAGVGLEVIPIDHPARMFNLDDMMIKIA
jgi:hypothetical protein